MDILLESNLAGLLVALASVCVLLYWYLTKNYDYWKKRDVQFAKPLPFFGNFKDSMLFRKPHYCVQQDLYRKMEGLKLFGTWQQANPILYICDPDLIKRIFVRDFAYFQDRGIKIDMKLNPLSAHLFSLEGALWRSLRAKLTPTFTSGKMRMMYTLMHECAREFVEFVDDQIRTSAEMEFKEVFAKMTTDVIGTCAFGLQCNSMKNPNSEFRAMGRKIFASMPRVLLGKILERMIPFIGKYFKAQLPPKDVSEFFIKVVTDTVEYRERNNVKRNDFLQFLIELKNTGRIEDENYDHKIFSKRELFENGDLKEIEFSDGLLAAQAYVFFVAGFETSSATMSFALHELTLNPDIQEKARNEIDRVLVESRGELTYEAIKKMEYLDNVVNESLRKYPPLGVLMRMCNKTHQDPDTGIVIDKGTLVHIPVYALHHDPKYFPEPERFDPDRFTEEEKAKRPHYAYLPFGEGPRACIGLRFGKLQAKLGLAALLSRFELSPCGRTQHPLALDPKAFITACKGGVWARVAPRTPGACSLRPSTAALGAH